MNEQSAINKKSSQQLSDSALAEIEKWCEKYPAEHRQSAILAALTIAQNEHGYLTDELMDEVADYLGVPHVVAYEAATFYTMLDRKPVGTHKISVCNSISCKLLGSEKVIAYLEEKLGIKIGDTTADGKCTLRQVECLAACAGAPMMQVDRDYHEHLTPEKIDAIIEGLES